MAEQFNLLVSHYKMEIVVDRAVEKRKQGMYVKHLALCILIYSAPVHRKWHISISDQNRHHYSQNVTPSHDRSECSECAEEKDLILWRNWQISLKASERLVLEPVLEDWLSKVNEAYGTCWGLIILLQKVGSKALMAFYATLRNVGRI